VDSEHPLMDDWLWSCSWRLSSLRGHKSCTTLRVLLMRGLCTIDELDMFVTRDEM